MPIKSEDLNNKNFPKKQDIVDQLETEERFKTYFDAFSASSVKQFIDRYAQQKELWWQTGKQNLASLESSDIYWINQAEEHLKIIQQKKLFDAQCLWRAEKAVFDEVEICFDFEVWSRDILNCPFIPQLTNEDIDLYSEYLLSDDKELDIRFLDDWQEYDNLMPDDSEEDDDDEDFLPLWYQFHNSRSGAGTYFRMPDIRGEKEEFYIKFAREKRNKKNNSKMINKEVPRDSRPYLSCHDDKAVALFISTYEDKQTKIYYDVYKKYHTNKDEQEELEDIIKDLLDATELVPIEGHVDFKEALRKAHETYNAKKITEFLPFAFDEYKFKKSSSLTAENEKGGRFQQFKELRKTFYDLIIEGRQINGEPADLNF